MGEGPALGGVERSIAEHEVGTNVTLLGGLTRPDLDERYRANDALVLLSATEGFPKVVIEALAHGLAVVVAEVGQVATEVDGAVIGVPLDDADAAADALVLHLSDPERLAAMRQRGREYAGRYTYEDHIERLAEFLPLADTAVGVL